ncbi:MAG: AAA family ATPase [Bdellovibrionota bacterium]
MTIKKLKILGFRGFSSEQSIEFSAPNGTDNGSGLTIITGANNSGKSSIIECLKARNSSQSPSFSVGSRNPKLDSVEIEYTVGEKIERITSLKKGSSETTKANYDANFQIFVLPSRRSFSPFFSKGYNNRQQYTISDGLQPLRSPSINNFHQRLFTIEKDPEKFNQILYEVLDFKPDWSIDQTDQGQHFLKFYNGNYSHTSDGMGEGIINIFSIVDSLYDSKPGDVVAIDEPELSLHPSLQKKVFHLFNKYSRDRQIIISTHSPYFIDIRSILNGANIVRVTNQGNGTEIFQMNEESKKIINELTTGNLYNPHILGLNAKELFFLEEKIIILEGQEDVLLFPKISEQLNIELTASFFGWGAGGAGNISKICSLLKNLGFKKVAAILDGNKLNTVPGLEKFFPDYHFCSICADDIRTKSEKKSSPAVNGLLDKDLNIINKYKEKTYTLFSDLNIYMNKKIETGQKI